MLLKVVHLTSAHPPLDHRIFHKQALSLAEAGYQVVIIGPGTGEIAVEQNIVIRTFKRARSRLDRFTRVLWQITRLATQESAAIYHFHDPDLILVGLWLRLLGKKVIYDVHEDVPRQILAKRWIPQIVRGPVARAMEGLEWLTAKAWSGIVAATPTIARRFPKAKLVTVQNFPSWQERSLEVPYPNRKRVVLYVGNLTEDRGIHEMIAAHRQLPAALGAELLLAGHFYPTALQELLPVPGVTHLGWLSRNEVLKCLGRARIGLVPLHPIQNYLVSQPVKLFEYMAAGIPVVASDFPLFREIISKAGCGLLIDPLNPSAIAGAIQWLLEHEEEAQAMGNRGRAAVKERYHWERERDSLFSLYRMLRPVPVESL